MRFPRRSSLPQVVASLEALYEEFPDQFSFISDGLLYARVGRDRRKLTMAYVDTVRADCVRFRAMERSLHVS